MIDSTPQPRIAPPQSRFVAYGEPEEAAVSDWCHAMAIRRLDGGSILHPEVSHATQLQRPTAPSAGRRCAWSRSGRARRRDWFRLSPRFIRSVTLWLIVFVLICAAGVLLGQAGLLEEAKDYHPSGFNVAGRTR